MSGRAAPDFLHIARLTIEARTPLSMATGEPGDDHDVALTRDANGLPQIRGSAAQGVIRALFDDLKQANLFGFQHGKQGSAGRIAFSDGCVHDSKGVAVLGRLAGSRIGKDPVLRLFADDAPLARDHVRLGHRHVAADRAKFDRVATPAGARFSFELAMWGDEADGESLKEAVALFAHPALRVGGAGGRGYGAVTLLPESCAIWSQELKSADACGLRDARRTAFSERPNGFERFAPAPQKFVWRREWREGLEPFGLWRIGGRGPSATAGKRSPAPSGASGLPARDGAPDALPLREPCIEWTPQGAQIKLPTTVDLLLVLPGASLRGVLAHRSLFHFNRLKGRWAGSGSNGVDPLVRPVELQAIFGAKRDGRGGSAGEGRAGRIFVDDQRVAAQHIAALDHNSLDRFTGGVRNRILFSEEAVLGGSIAVRICLAPPRPGDGDYDSDALRALDLAVSDLAEGRLAIGAKSLGFLRRPKGAKAA